MLSKVALARSILHSQRNIATIQASQNHRSQSRPFNYSYFLTAPLFLYLLNQAKENSCEEPSRQDKIRGTYENKIRFFSHPEKIFETFASKKQDDGTLVMSYADFFKALTPYNYTEMREMSSYFENNEIAALKLADVNGDGVIDFTEFFFFITIMQIPETIIEDVFRKHGNKPDTISAEDFGKVLTELRKNTVLGAKQTNKSFLDTRLVKATEEDFKITNKSIAIHMLNGEPEINLKRFFEYREELKTALRHYEFHNYDVDENNTISLEDFSKSLLVCLPIKTSQVYVKRIHSLKLDGRVTFCEFIAFQNFIDEADQIKKKILAYKYITLEQLVVLADEFSKKDSFCCKNKV